VIEWLGSGLAPCDSRVAIGRVSFLVFSKDSFIYEVSQVAAWQDDKMAQPMVLSFLRYP
jgi:hypothetical protein